MLRLSQCAPVFAASFVLLFSACSTLSQARSGSSEVQSPASMIPLPKEAGGQVPAGYDKVDRNRWIEANLIRIDADYYATEQKLQQKRTRFNIGTSTAALLFNVASSLTPSAGVKANYVAANSLATGTSTIVNRDQFFEQTVATLTAAMRAQREKAFAVVRIGMTKEADEYLVSEAHRDLLAYEAAGTLQEGMKFVLETTEQKAQEDVTKSQSAIQDAVAYTEDERQLTYCISMSLQALDATKLPALRDVGAAHDVEISDKASLDEAKELVSKSMLNRPPKYQRDLYAHLAEKKLALNPCPRY